MKDAEVAVPVRSKAGPKVKEARFVLSYRTAHRTQPNRRTIKLPASAHDIHARVTYILEAMVEFDIPVEAVEAGLAEWFNRTEGELASFVGAKR